MAKGEKYRGESGLVVVDKAAGMTSHDVVARCRKLYGTRKVGHAGTLDPMATGALVLGIGHATKLLTYVVGADKTYTATVRLGQSTVTDDAEGEITSSAGATLELVSPDALADTVAPLKGDILQVPSSVSAIKVEGQRSYALVRSGEKVTLAARPVTVARFEVGVPRAATAANGTQVVDVDVEVDVSSGTYVRALARDMGATLGTGGHLTGLRRLRVGPFTLDAAHTLDELAAAGQAAPSGTPPMVPMAAAAAGLFPVRFLGADEIRDLVHGKRIGVSGVGASEPDQPVAGLDAATHRLVALLSEQGHQCRSLLVFPPY